VLHPLQSQPITINSSPAPPFPHFSLLKSTIHINSPSHREPTAHRINQLLPSPQSSHSTHTCNLTIITSPNSLHNHQSTPTLTSSARINTHHQPLLSFITNNQSLHPNQAVAVIKAAARKPAIHPKQPPALISKETRVSLFPQSCPDFQTAAALPPSILATSYAASNLAAAENKKRNLEKKE
jgi:hypothetical protein